MQNYTLFHKDISLTVEQGELLGSFQLRPTPKGAEHRMINREISRLVPTLEVQKLAYPELAEGETLDLEALYASVDWSKPVELPLSLYSQFKQAQSVETGMGVIYAQEEAQEYVPQHIRELTVRDFLRLFPDSVRRSLTGGSLQGVDLRMWFDEILAGPDVHLDYPGLEEKLQQLVGVIPDFTQEAKDQVMMGKQIG